MARGGGVTEGGEKEGESEASRGEENSWYQNDFLQTLHTDFFPLKQRNADLFIWDGREIFFFLMMSNLDP